MRFVVDAGTVLHLLAEDIEVSNDNQRDGPYPVRRLVESCLENQKYAQTTGR